MAGADPTARAVALRRLGANITLDDRLLVWPLLGDTRLAGELPTFPPVVLYGQCQPLTWRATTVRAEALVALSRLHATWFDSVDAYRAWVARNPDPQPSFAESYARVASRRPADPAALQRLKAGDPLVVARVVAIYCDADLDCGGPEAMDALMRGTIDGPRALRWITRAESWPEWKTVEDHHQVVDVLLAHGEGIFTDADVPALQAVAPQLAPYNQARLAVLTSRLRPKEARAMWSSALAQLERGHELVLEEAARRDPTVFVTELAAWFRGGHAAPILEGLAAAGPGARPTLAKLVARPGLTATVPDVGVSLAKAAIAHGCKGVPHPNTMDYWPAKGESMESRDRGDAAAKKAREKLIRQVRICLR